MNGNGAGNGTGNGHANGHANGHGNGHDPFAENPFLDDDDEPQPQTTTRPWTFTGDVPTFSWWIDRDLPPRDCLLGEMMATTSRLLLIGPTGLGKTNFGLALSMALTTGSDFLHWRVSRPARVLYIDGEMPNRLIKKRIIDAGRRNGGGSDNFVLLSREDYPDMPPLNTPEGQRFIDDFMDWAGSPDSNGERGFDAVVFDNLQALLIGDLKEPAHWEKMLPWTRELSRRAIAQLYIHHTGLDKTHGYGDSTREWGLESTMIMEEVEDTGGDIAFRLKFIKARERTPENRADFDEAVITLADDEWTSDRDLAARRPAKARTADDYALDQLDKALIDHGSYPGGAKIPNQKQCVTLDLWRRYFVQNFIGGADEKSVLTAFYRSAAKLQSGQRVAAEKPWVWRV